RTLPDIEVENYWFRRHEVAYRAAVPFVTGARVLEAGAGEGYGAQILRHGGAGAVVAVDYDSSAVTHLAARYRQLAPVRGDLQRLPVATGAVDCVVSLQVIEHLHDQPGFLAECARVLRPAGTLVVSTPNRATFSPGLDTPRNPFHTRELTADELVALLAPRFAVSRLWGVWHGPVLRRWERRHGSLIDAQLAGPPESWAAPVRRRVMSVATRDFKVTDRNPAGSLDLLTVAWRRP
ncbi:MAG: class I SAM-dependent methyltransferase, partial [Mycobacteriales bacterium]